MEVSVTFLGLFLSCRQITMEEGSICAIKGKLGSLAIARKNSQE